MRKLTKIITLTAISLLALTGCEAIDAANESVRENNEPAEQRREAEQAEQRAKNIEESLGIDMSSTPLPSHGGIVNASLVCADDYAIMHFSEDGYHAQGSAAVRLPEFDEKCADG